MFKNLRKSLIQHCERSQLRSCQKCSTWCVFKPEVCGQIVLPDRSILKGQNLSKNAKIKNSDAKIETFEKHENEKKLVKWKEMNWHFIRQMDRHQRKMMSSQNSAMIGWST